MYGCFVLLLVWCRLKLLFNFADMVGSRDWLFGVKNRVGVRRRDVFKLDWSKQVQSHIEHVRARFCFFTRVIIEICNLSMLHTWSPQTMTVRCSKLFFFPWPDATDLSR